MLRSPRAPLPYPEAHPPNLLWWTPPAMPASPPGTGFPGVWVQPGKDGLGSGGG